MTHDQLKKANALAAKIEKQEQFVKIAEILVQNGDSVNTYLCVSVPGDRHPLESYLDKKTNQELAKKVLEAAKKQLDDLREQFANL